MGLFNDNWSFALFSLGTSLEQALERKERFLPVGLPHDWLIRDTKNLYKEGMGWYRKEFDLKPQEAKQYFLRFEGIYMDAAIYINGHLAGEWKYGYTTFMVDMSPWLCSGTNEVLVSVNFQAPNSRWYTGAGIYRDVWFAEVPKQHLVWDGLYFSAKKLQKGCWSVAIDAEVAGEKPENCRLSFGIWDKENGKKLGLTGGCESPVWEAGIWKIRFRGECENPKIWDVEAPHCYQLEVALEGEGRIFHSLSQTVGFRSCHFSPKEGFFLNEKRLKLQGVCEHHDLGCLGAAFHQQAARRRMELLKEMGVNAIRISHNMPAPGIMELADEMGFLIVNEAFDMWRTPKNPYDYARFFKDWYKKDVKNWVRRDRNHPCMLMWSIGNEISDTNTEEGAFWCRALQKEVLLYDPRENARVTLASNYMPWEHAWESADIVQLIGYNYGEKYYKAHHKAHPEWILYGSETGSVVQSRGIYHFPYQQPVLTDADRQCSSLGNSATSWGARSALACIQAETAHPFSLGQFIWTGFDYIGEPTPYHTKNSYFGQMDTAGFPKDSFYIYQAAWQDCKTKPMVHIFPYWDFNEGQLIDLLVCSNAPVVELFLNGKSQGIWESDQNHGAVCGHWQLPYEEGEIMALACDDAGNEIARDIRRSFGEGKVIRAELSKEFLYSNGEDLLFVEISLEDERGNPVENANNRVEIRVEGAGALIGTDNGDSTDEESYQSPSRRLFSGRLLAVCKAGTRPGWLQITIEGEGLERAVYLVPVKEGKIREGAAPNAHLFQEKLPPVSQEIYPRTIKLVSRGGMHLDPEHPSCFVSARILPERAEDGRLYWQITDDAGIPVKNALLREEEGGAKLQAVSDGNFRLRCMSKSGTEHIRLISSLEFMVTGFGRAFTNPYDFVSAGLYSFSHGEIGNGNDHGVATAREGETVVGFSNLDFGKTGSDEITVPIFALTEEPCPFRIYEGDPHGEGTLLGEFVYQKPKIWNVYQEAVWKLNRRLKGVVSLSFVLEQKVHIKGFVFKESSRALEPLTGEDCDRVYGDSFTKKGKEILGIGNNVTLEFKNLDFGEEGVNHITIEGSTPLAENPIDIRLIRGEEETRVMAGFVSGKKQQDFFIGTVQGKRDLRLVFLPGCQFDFYSIRFWKGEAPGA